MIGGLVKKLTFFLGVAEAQESVLTYDWVSGKTERGDNLSHGAVKEKGAPIYPLREP